ncbi:hypothetical protein Elgi_46900 [Paenibacillus elgii]|nr:hypothetical protein Elgi_46900 [Paenibacillus elgii]
MSFIHVVYGGNGTTPVDSGLPRVGEIYGVDQNGNLRWYRYKGNGEYNPAGNQGWYPNSGNIVGNGWHSFRNLFSGGNGVLYGVEQNGNLRWYQYLGNGEHNPAGNQGWYSNSGNIIGNGWHNFRFIFSSPWEGREVPNRSAIYGVDQNGNLRWYRYLGNGEHNPAGNQGWHPNSGNTIGNGWHSFRHVVAISGVILAVKENGDLLWYYYLGNGEHNPAGNQGWHPNSGNTIGNGWHGFRHIFGGYNDSYPGGIVIYGVEQNGNLRWYRYKGNGEHNPAGNQGWYPNSGNVIGNGW